MKKLIKILICAIFVLLNCSSVFAYTEKFTKTDLVNFGNGIVVPSRFDVINDDGSLTYVEKMNVSLFDTTNQYADDNTILLEYDYTANRLFDKGDNSKGILPHGKIRINDEDGNKVFYLGRDANNVMICGLCDKNGDYSVCRFDQSRSFADGEYEYYQIKSFTVYNSESQIKKDYYFIDGEFRLNAKYDYSDADCLCTEYYIMPWINKSAIDEESSDFEKFSFREGNLGYQDIKKLDYIYDYTSGTYKCEVNEGEYLVPLVVTDHTTDKYAVILSHNTSNYLKGEYRIEKYDTINYFTREQIEAIASEGISSYEELMNKHADFLLNPIYAADEDTSEDKNEKYFIEDENVLVQTLTGNIAPINGVMPVKLETKWENKGDSEEITISLVDKDRNVLARMITWDDSHKNYKYAKIASMMNLSDTEVLFEVQGTDVPTFGSNKDFGSVRPKNENAIKEKQQYEEEGFSDN